jgi:hypothetical protein
MLVAVKNGVKNFHNEHTRSRSQHELFVGRATIFMFSPRSFVAPRYFCFHRDALLLMRHDTFLFARTSFDLKMITLRLTGAASKKKYV